MEEIFKALATSGEGALGMILAIMIWDNIKMKNKLFTIIENNTSALRDLKNSVSDIKKA